MSSIGSLSRLTELAPPPEIPVRANGDWKRFVSANGFWPPEDYRMLIREYGVGTFGDWLYLIEPFHPGISFVDNAERECRVLRLNQRESPQAYPDWPIWPDPGGLLPWATTSTGDHVGWRTVGRPQFWTTLFWGRGGDCSTELAVNTVGFLVGLAERSLGDPTFDTGKSPFVLSNGHRFLPATT